MIQTEIKLTRYSHGAGCGCKISPKVLSAILGTKSETRPDEKLIVGNTSRDDAAVYDLGNGRGLISTTDFFMPIVDDPFTFGRIAGTNAISDVYAMGGTPLMAIAILGWPVNVISPDIAQLVLEGGRKACSDAGISLAGGHSIDSPEPIFGLSVNGMVELANLKRNDTADEGCLLYLTKPLGVGILTTAQKQSILRTQHNHIAPDLMCRPNIIGPVLASIPGVKAMTDVTGFGLLGHLAEMCQGSEVSAVVKFDKVPRLPEADEYSLAGCIPGGTDRNWDSYGNEVLLARKEFRDILCDPQTSGGLLLAVDPGSREQVENLLQNSGLPSDPFGTLIGRQGVLIEVQ